MGRHALAANKIAELGNKYVVISKPDLKALDKLITMARGGLSVETFSHKSRVSCQIMYDIASGKRKTNVNYQHLLSIAENADPGSGVTLKMLMDANGMIDAEAIRKNIDSLSTRVSEINAMPAQEVGSAASPKKHGRKKNAPAKQETGIPEATGDPYSNYIKDLAYYAGLKKNDQIKTLHDGKDLYYADLAIKKMLSLFRWKSEEDKSKRIEALKEYFRTGLERDFPNASAAEYEHVLDELLLGKEKIF